MIRMKGDPNSTRYTAQPLNSPILERDIIQPNPYQNSGQIIFLKLHVRLPTFKHQRPVCHVPWGSFQHISGMIDRIKSEEEETIIQR